MVRLLSSIALLLASSCLASAKLQLTPRLEEYQLDGVKFKQLVFPEDNGTTITYTPPAGWTFFGEPAKLTLRPSNKTQVDGSVTIVPLPAGSAPLDEATIAALSAEALRSIPAGGADVTVTSVERSPVLIGNKETLLVKMQYTFYGENYGRSVLFLNRGAEQIRFELVARLADFKELQQAFLQSQFTWQGL